MEFRKVILGLVIFLVVIASSLIFTDKVMRAQEATSDPEVSKKLDTILDNQKKMLEDIASIKEELSIIRVRVTR